MNGLNKSILGNRFLVIPLRITTLSQSKLSTLRVCIWNLAIWHTGHGYLHFLTNLPMSLDTAMLKAQNLAYLPHLRGLHRIFLADMNGA